MKMKSVNRQEAVTSHIVADANEVLDIPVSSNDIPQLVNITKFFFAYRGFTADADRILNEIGFGRAHHRVLFFVCRKPGMNVAELLQILSITKQSLARVLRQMVVKKYVVQKTGQTDRRQRLLYPTSAGSKLMLALSQLQTSRLSNAIKQSGVSDVDQISRFLDAMIDPDERELMERLVPAGNNR